MLLHLNCFRRISLFEFSFSGKSIRQTHFKMEDRTDWNAQKERINQLYNVENRPLSEVQDIMQERYGFEGTYVRSSLSFYLFVTGIVAHNS